MSQLRVCRYRKAGLAIGSFPDGLTGRSLKKTNTISFFKILLLGFYPLPLHLWFHPNTLVSRCPIEDKLMFRHKLQDIVHSNIPFKHSKLKFGPIISLFIAVWHFVSKRISISSCATHSLKINSSAKVQWFICRLLN